MLRHADALLERHVAALNAINVFPVPDGDTGTNMHLTMRASIEALERVEAANLQDVAAAAAHGALMGARGNSGVILSQILRGFSQALKDSEKGSQEMIVAALQSSSDAAYAALAEPKEGTILTVIRAAAKGAKGKGDVASTFDSAAAAAHDAVARTPELLPVLKEAGVVDAGGLGLAIVLEAFARSYRGDSLDVDLSPDMPASTDWQREAVSLHQAEHGEAGYCTEFVVSGSDLDQDAVREQLAPRGGSLLVVGDEEALHVHIHTQTPDDVLAYGRTLGSVAAVKVDNMAEQTRTFAGTSTAEPAPLAVGDLDIVAVAAGEGIKAALRSIGVAQVVEGGQTMNPSAAEILDAVKAAAHDTVIILPNNKNIIASAEQAARESDKGVTVVASRTIPQGIAAILSLSPDASLDENVAGMNEALASVRSAEVTRSVRATVIDGRKIEVGQAIGIVDGTLDVVGDSIEDAVEECVARMRPGDASLLTVYSGADVAAADADALVNRIRSAYPELEVELVDGGQPHYPYLLSLE